MRYSTEVENIFLPSSSTPVVNPFPLVIAATGVCCIYDGMLICVETVLSFCII